MKHFKGMWNMKQPLAIVVADWAKLNASNLGYLKNADSEMCGPYPLVN